MREEVAVPAGDLVEPRHLPDIPRYVFFTFFLHLMYTQTQNHDGRRRNHQKTNRAKTRRRAQETRRSLQNNHCSQETRRPPCDRGSRCAPSSRCAQETRRPAQGSPAQGRPAQGRPA